MVTGKLLPCFDARALFFTSSSQSDVSCSHLWAMSRQSWQVLTGRQPPAASAQPQTSSLLVRSPCYLTLHESFFMPATGLYHVSLCCHDQKLTKESVKKDLFLAVQLALRTRRLRARRCCGWPLTWRSTMGSWRRCTWRPWWARPSRFATRCRRCWRRAPRCGPPPSPLQPPATSRSQPHPSSQPEPHAGQTYSVSAEAQRSLEAGLKK